MAAMPILTYFVFIVFIFGLYRHKTDKNVQSIDDIPDDSEYI